MASLVTTRKHGEFVESVKVVHLIKSNTFHSALKNGLVFHVHSFWNNNAISASNAGCGPDLTGGHYDPFLTCSKSSEDAKGKCADLKRTEDDEYKYPCNADAYAAGNFALCEVGDLSTKFSGVFMPDENMVWEANGLYDPIAPFRSNYNLEDEIANQWSSVVFHCKDDASRLFCAEIVAN